MKAAVFHGSDKGLIIEDIPVPQIKDDEILVKVAACGVCHTDVGFAVEGVPTRHPLPLILGHEISGRVIRTGANATWATPSRSWPPGVPSPRMIQSR